MTTIDPRTSEAARAEFAEAALPREQVVKVREKLRIAARYVGVLTGESGGELVAEGRTLWLYSLLPLSTLHDLAGALTLVNDVVRFLENWTDCARPRPTCPERDDLEWAAGLLKEIAAKPEVSVVDFGFYEGTRVRLLARAAKFPPKRAGERADDTFHETFVEPALRACIAALNALVTLVDEMQLGAPEVLR